MHTLLAEYRALEQSKPLWRKKPRAFHEQGFLHFESNDYLALAQNPTLIAAYQEGFTRFGTSSSASPLLSGYCEAHEALESRFCELFRMQDAMLFSSGFAANLAIGRMLSAFSASVALDKASHASIYDGLDTKKIRLQRFVTKEDDIRVLGSNGSNSRLSGNSPQILWLEGVYSMSGHIPNITKLAVLFPEAMYIIDEAHAFGLLGTHGLGFADHAHIPNDKILFRVIPFGKAMAGQGAIVLGSWDAIDVLRQYARSYIYSTAISGAQAFGLQHALDLLLTADDNRQKLLNLRHLFQQDRPNKNISPIQRVYCRDIQAAIALQHFLWKRHIAVSLVRPPTVSMNEVGLRIVLNAGHTEQEILRLRDALLEYADAAYAC